MARESCNLDKEEAEILKPSSPSSSAPSPPAPASASPSSLIHMPSQELPIHDVERAEAVPASNPVVAAAPREEEKASEEEEEPQAPVRFTNRCSCCRRKVGLTGFRCRCGDLFCCRHRYSDAHDCSFDYKAAGREEISKANPVIRAAKIIKI